MPMGISMLSQGFHRINYQLVNGINVTSVKTPNRVVFNQRDPFYRRSIRCHEETINSVVHLYQLRELRRNCKILASPRPKLLASGAHEKGPRCASQTEAQGGTKRTRNSPAESTYSLKLKPL